ncbi:YggS family pyridoxal phosphate-dependent enzyme [Nocardia macrotermitis]|uniref:Pyridoxal phosphate homeostasis protein n=1 Tax=Nocardia macrotermitis TaxID=2585198 RepID=A0A7K0D8T9_9NOCA|nr:YggS family pyridoxal phosphate-dependent enzyme [Nocardia macrotermitis]MQY21284.1 Pyridoxal phosphate homeostasis protein [Nocardia macrotermitis]
MIGEFGRATAESGTRTDALATALTGLCERIDAACRAAGRDPAQVRLLPVTKFFPASDVAILYRLGRREFGESREQEATAKAAELADLPGVEWHMIGRLQRNKAKAVARWAHTVHSLDSARLATALDAGVRAVRDAGERQGPLRVLLQVALDDDPTRGGVAPADLPELADQVASLENLQLAGLMAIPPQRCDPDAEFARLADLHVRFLTQHPAGTELSAGMSGDLEAAIRHGSTCVRVGTALMGARPITSG